jgi:predicted amidohydrolase
MLQGGELPPVFEINGVNCGLAICYDLRFPEVFRSLSGNNADIFIVPSAWYAGEHKIFHLKTLLAARSIENTAYIACSNVSGGSFCGNSSVFDPFGIELESLSEGTDVIYSEINKKRINEVRKSLPCLENFRNDIF